MNSLLLIAALGTGLAVGAWFGSRRCRRICEEYQLATVNLEALQSLRALERLRAGNAEETVSSLEIQLDTALVQFGGWSRERRLSPDHIQTLKEARKYRDWFPRTWKPNVDAAVAKALALAGEVRST